MTTWRVYIHQPDERAVLLGTVMASTAVEALTLARQDAPESRRDQVYVIPLT